MADEPINSLKKKKKKKLSHYVCCKYMTIPLWKMKILMILNHDTVIFTILCLYLLSIFSSVSLENLCRKNT